MPLKTDATGVRFNARFDGNFNKPFSEQVNFLRQKLNIPTAHYDDILKSAHDRAFMVAGAMSADLLSDFRAAVDNAINNGKSLGWFQKEFDKIVAKHGWDYTGSRNWRSRVIYTTNLQASYAAGRYQQLTDPDLLASRPYWRYVHNDTVRHPRPLHLAWGQKPVVLKHDDPWWQSHYPPNGWGCRCRVEAVRAKDYPGDPAPDDGFRTLKDRYGQTHDVPNGIDYGWDYAPGSLRQQLLARVVDKAELWPWQIAKANVSALVVSKVFERFFNGKINGEFPVAVLDDKTRDLLAAEANVVLLSRQTIDEHVEKHAEITVEDYRMAQEIIDHGEMYLQGESRLVFLHYKDFWYRAALKRTMDFKRNYFLTLFRNDKKMPPKGAKKVR